MREMLGLVAITTTISGCVGGQRDAERPRSSRFSVAASPIATVAFIGSDTLSDSAHIYRLEPEPDGGSVAFFFADPTKGITQGLGIIQTSGPQLPHLVWPDSVVSAWWSGTHQLSFIAGTGRGVRVIVDAHAAQLEALEASRTPSAPFPDSSPSQSNANARSRAQAFIDSIRVQPEGRPQRSALRYRADTILVGRGDTIAAVHVSAAEGQGPKVNPTWYLVHLPSGQVQAVDSLIGSSAGLLSSAGQWGADGSFYYAKERSIWRARPIAE
jgi:hypothetical protein